MAQDGTTAGGSSYTIDNVTFPIGRTKLQSIFDAIRSTNIGNTAPDLVAGQFWIDNNTPSTTVWTLYFYDGTDNISFATIDTINNTVNFLDSTFDLINDTTPQLGGNLDLNSNDITGTGNINITGTIQSSGNITGTLATASQPNITSVGTLTSFASTGIDDNATSTAITINSSQHVELHGGQIESNNNTSSITYSGGDNSNAGANLTLFGGSHATTPNVARFRSSATEVMRITSSGNVGIGTSSPDNILMVSSDGASASAQPLSIVNPSRYGASDSVELEFGMGRANDTNNLNFPIIGLQKEQEWIGASTNVDASVIFKSVSNQTASEAMRIDSSGAVSIATTSAANGEKLKVQGKIYINAAESDSIFTTGACLIFPGTYNNIRQSTDHSLVFDAWNNSNVNSPLTIKQDGKIGIGTSSPEVPLSVVGLDTQIHFSESADSGGYLMSEAAGQFRISGGAAFKVGNTGWTAKSTEAAIIGHDSGGDIKFFSNTGLTVGNNFTPTERMRINSSGQTLIGTTVAPGNANTKLMVHIPISTSSGNVIELSHNTNGANKAGAALGLSIGNGGEATNAASLSFKTASGGSLGERMRIDSSGNVGIGTSSPASKLTVSDANTAFVYVEENTGDVGDTAGILFKTSPSDGFFKSGIILEDDGTSYARGKLHIVQNSAENNTNATVSDAKITILNDGNVGIGTTTPSQALDVVGSIEVSDGIYIGGTAAANKLDDYEEGTWTPRSTFANDTASGQAGAYTKVGNMVVATFQIVFSTTSFAVNVALAGLPFTNNSTTGNASGASIGFYNGTSTTLQLYLAENSSQLDLRDIDGNIQHNSAKVTGKTLRGVVVYRTA
jgi:hypothetical protein